MNSECHFDENSEFHLLEPIISDEDNILLCAEISFLEETTTVFDLAPD